MLTREDALLGCLLGTAVGDAIGLCCEGLSPRRQRRLFGAVEGHRLLFGRGMVSDDTEHACMTAQALLASAGEPAQFERALASQLRLWLLCLPPGAGKATLAASLKLCFGVPPRRSGVSSAGNGPAMRSPILGVCWGHDLHRLRELVRASTRITHTDPRAEHGALAIAIAAHMAGASRLEDALPEAYCKMLQRVLPPEARDLSNFAGAARESAAAGEDTESFLAAIGLHNGVTGYIAHTAAAALHLWFRHPSDYRAAVLGAVRCGGDTDTLAAVAGGIVGATTGRAGIPEEWLAGLCDWPMSVRWMEDLAAALAGSLATGKRLAPLPLPVTARCLRNAFFLLVVLLHGFRRLLPPYG